MQAILSCETEFLGTHFDEITRLLSISLEKKIYGWLSKVVRKKIQPIAIGSKKPYRQWAMSDLLVFRYPFVIGKAQYRILLVKVKNSVYIEFHLGNHKYYDKVRKELDL